MKNNKQTIRQDCLSHRRALSKKQKTSFSTTILNTFNHCLEQEHADGIHILCYRSLTDEVNTSSLFLSSSKHQYYAPVTQKNGNMQWLNVNSETQWGEGLFNIFEPMNGKHWEANNIPAILLCPVVGFDRMGNRIGMGKGCFDRWLATHQKNFTMLIGLAFSCQECPTIKQEAHDIPLDAIITEKGWISCPNI